MNFLLFSRNYTTQTEHNDQNYEHDQNYEATDQKQKFFDPETNGSSNLSETNHEFHEHEFDSTTDTLPPQKNDSSEGKQNSGSLLPILLGTLLIAGGFFGVRYYLDNKKKLVTEKDSSYKPISGDNSPTDLARRKSGNRKENSPKLPPKEEAKPSQGTLTAQGANGSVDKMKLVPKSEKKKKIDPKQLQRSIMSENDLKKITQYRIDYQHKGNIFVQNENNWESYFTKHEFDFLKACCDGKENSIEKEKLDVTNWTVKEQKNEYYKNLTTKERVIAIFRSFFQLYPEDFMMRAFASSFFEYFGPILLNGEKPNSTKKLTVIKNSVQSYYGTNVTDTVVQLITKQQQRVIDFLLGKSYSDNIVRDAFLAFDYMMKVQQLTSVFNVTKLGTEKDYIFLTLKQFEHEQDSFDTFISNPKEIVESSQISSQQNLFIIFSLLKDKDESKILNDATHLLYTEQESVFEKITNKAKKAQAELFYNNFKEGDEVFAVLTKTNEIDENGEVLEKTENFDVSFFLSMGQVLTNVIESNLNRSNKPEGNASTEEQKQLLQKTIETQKENAKTDIIRFIFRNGCYKVGISGENFESEQYLEKIFLMYKPAEKKGDEK